MERRGVRRFVYTDISRDGTLEGPNVEMYRTLGLHLKKARITASGGVSGYRDLMRLQELELPGRLGHHRPGALRKPIPLPAVLVLARQGERGPDPLFDGSPETRNQTTHRRIACRWPVALFPAWMLTAGAWSKG
ncbi:HisA/HisF-related TIM barrel protein [Rhodothermus marinus]|uniref:HisA/HisF-related TIM barrel protein n=1 Tax=Rhodothermus marinus TaxID=29549 RepID=UPI000AEF75B6|nr:HisA/HisF-related TIM barrel protein [Rhodothermus marinus]